MDPCRSDPTDATVQPIRPILARTPDEIRAARDDWQAGRRFGAVEAYDGSRLEAPPLIARPVPGEPDELIAPDSGPFFVLTGIQTGP